MVRRFFRNRKLPLINNQSWPREKIPITGLEFYADEGQVTLNLWDQEKPRIKVGGIKHIVFEPAAHTEFYPIVGLDVSYGPDNSTLITFDRELMEQRDITVLAEKIEDTIQIFLGLKR